MADVTVTFKDGTTHTYQGVPDGMTPDAVEQRAVTDFGKPVASLGKAAVQGGLLDKVAGTIAGGINTAYNAIPFAQDINAGLNTAINPKVWTGQTPIGTAYDQARQVGRTSADTFMAAHPMATGAIQGTTMGATLLLPALDEAAGATKLAQGASTGAKVANTMMSAGRGATLSGAAGTVYALGSDGTPQQRLNNAMAQLPVSMALGGVLGGAGGALANRAAPAATGPTPQRVLSRMGVQLTPGQMIGGPAQRLEDGLSSVPLVGDPIKAAQRAGLGSFNAAVANRTLEPLGETVPSTVPAGRALAQHVQDRVSAAYTSALNGVTVAPDQQFGQAVAAARATLDPQAAQEFDTVMANTIGRQFSGPITGDTLKGIDQELGGIAAKYRSGASARPLDAYTADAVSKVQDALDGVLGRTNPKALAAKTAADEAYANLVRFQGAASSQGAKGGVFSAPMLNASVRRADPTIRKNSFGRGDALMQDMTDPAMDVLPQTVPDSGTAFRSLAALGAGGAATGAIHTPALAAAIASLSATNAIYSRPAIAALNALYRATDTGSAAQAAAKMTALARQYPDLQPIFQRALSPSRSPNAMMLQGAGAVSANAMSAQ